MKLKKSVFFILFVFSISLSYAQWKTNLNLGSTFYSGTKINKFDFLTDFNVSHTDTIFEYSTFFSAYYGEISHARVNQEFNGGLKFDYQPEARVTPFVVFQAYNNVEKNIDLRLTGLLGVKFALYKEAVENAKKSEAKRNEYSISGAVLYETEQYISGSVNNKEKVKLSIRPKIKQSLGKSLSFEHITFFKFEINEPEFYGIYSNTSLSTKLLKWLALKVTYRVDYDNKLPKSKVLEGESPYEKNIYKVFYTSISINF